MLLKYDPMKKCWCFLTTIVDLGSGLGAAAPRLCWASLSFVANKRSRRRDFHQCPHTISSISVYSQLSPCQKLSWLLHSQSSLHIKHELSYYQHRTVKQQMDININNERKLAVSQKAYVQRRNRIELFKMKTFLFSHCQVSEKVKEK